LINLGASAPTTTHGRNTMRIAHLLIDTIAVLGLFAIPLIMLVL